VLGERVRDDAELYKELGSTSQSRYTESICSVFRSPWSVRWSSVSEHSHMMSLYFSIVHFVPRIRDSAVGVATGYELDDRGVGVRVPVGSRIFSMWSRPTLGLTQPPILYNGYWGSFSGGKAAGA
jgi:hypothetical protein